MAEISSNRQGYLDKPAMRKLASLRVYRKNFETQQEFCTEPKNLKHPKGIMNYSWRLFRDKLNSNCLILSDV